MVGDPGRMMIRFNTAKHSDQAAGKGFSVTVEAVESGMIYMFVQNLRGTGQTISNQLIYTQHFDILAAAKLCYMIITSP